MGFKLISKDGDFLSLMHRISEQHKDVKVYVASKSKIYDGILEKVDSAISLDIQPDDTVIFDMVGAGDTAETLKSKGYYVVGGGSLNDKLELDRDYGTHFMREHGISVPETNTFEDFQKARDHVKSTNKRYVFKPNGNLNVDLTYVSESSEDMLHMLPYLEEQCGHGIEFQLQEFIDGIEMSTEGWFNGTDFLRPINSTMEEKKFMVGDIGPNTGCMGNVVWFWQDEISDYMYKTLFEPLKPTLEQAGYIGPIDINAIWTENGPYGLEFTARFGYDAIQAMSMMLSEDIGTFLENLRVYSDMPLSGTDRTMGVAVRVSIPPYPSEGEVPEIPIGPIKKKYAPNIFLSDVQVKDDGKLYCAGVDGYVYTVAESGDVMNSILKKVYTVIETTPTPHGQYRVDIGNRVTAERRQVERWILDRVATG